MGAQKNHLIETVLLSTHSICFGWEIRKLDFRYTLLTNVLGDGAYRQSGVKNSYLWFLHFSGETKNCENFARSVLYCWMSDRIIFSNIQIHCYLCFKLPIKIHYEELHLSYVILTIFSWKNHPVTTVWAYFFMAKPRISVKWAPK